MAFNIVTALQERMGFEPFEKIDPNYRKDSVALTRTPAHFEQAAGMAVLAGIYQYGSEREGAWRLLHPDDSNLLTGLFRGRQDTISEEVGYYRDDAEKEDTLPLLHRIAVAAIQLIREQLPDKGGNPPEPKDIENILTAQRHNILAYLPPEIETGKSLGDNSLDDRTNKMEGPVSGLMHFFENVFAEKE